MGDLANAMGCPGRPGFAGVASRVAALRLFCCRAACAQNGGPARDPGRFKRQRRERDRESTHTHSAAQKEESERGPTPTAPRRSGPPKPCKPAVRVYGWPGAWGEETNRGVLGYR